MEDDDKDSKIWTVRPMSIVSLVLHSCCCFFFFLFSVIPDDDVFYGLRSFRLALAIMQEPRCVCVSVCIC